MPISDSTFAAVRAIVAVRFFGLERNDIKFFPIVKFLFRRTTFDDAAIKIFLAVLANSFAVFCSARDP